MPAAEHTVTLPERYTVLHRVASGGMATVWAAEDQVLGRRVAVKVLSEVLAEDESAKARFLREARAGARLSDHPHVVTVYDLGEHAGRAFMVMELMAGGTLASRLASGRRPPFSLAVRWLAEAAGALDAAHALDVVHRDVKPANLLLDDRNRLAVADFGIASVAGEMSVTQTGLVMGTAPYLAPEQALGEPATPASDRYALACVAFELLTGRRPFLAEGPAGQARAHVDEPPPRASEVEPALPAAVDEALVTAMAKDPAQRPPSAAALAESIGWALDQDVTATTRAVRPGPAAAVAAGPDATAAMARTPTPAPAPAPAPLVRAERQRPRPAPAGRPIGAPVQERRRPWTAIALGALALLVAGVVLAAVLGGGGDQPQTAERATGAQERTAAEEEPAPAASAPPEDEQVPEPPPETQAPAEPQGETPAGDPQQLSDRAYGLLQGGDPAAAVPLARQAVEGFRARGDTDGLPYAFALYNLGASLNRSGSPAEAIPFLEERLKISDNQRGVVERELADARANVEGGGAAKPGKGKGKDKDD